MSTSFELDGSGVTDPLSFAYEELYSPFKAATGNRIVSAYHAAIASFPVLTSAQYSTWCSACDGAAHSIKCPAPNTNTMTTYSTVFLEKIGGEHSFGIYFYNVEIRVTHISALAAFGA